MTWGDELCLFSTCTSVEHSVKGTKLPLLSDCVHGERIDSRVVCSHTHQDVDPYRKLTLNLRVFTKHIVGA